MEVFAGFTSQADHEMGRIIDAFRETGQLENTLVIYIAGDNGASLEGSLDGTDNIMELVNGINTPASEVLTHLTEVGGPNSNPHYPVPWAWGTHRFNGEAFRLTSRRHTEPDGGVVARTYRRCGGRGRVRASHRRFPHHSRSRTSRSRRRLTASRSSRLTARVSSARWPTRPPQSGTRSSISKCTATARCMTTGGWRLGAAVCCHGHRRLEARRASRRGSCTTSNTIT